jgi:hypothetical protein
MAIKSILLPFCIFCCHLVYLTAILYILWTFDIPILWLFGKFFPVLVRCTKKSLATLIVTFGCGFWELEDDETTEPRLQSANCLDT